MLSCKSHEVESVRRQKLQAKPLQFILSCKSHEVKSIKLQKIKLQSLSNNMLDFLFRIKQQLTGNAEHVLGDAIHLTSLQEFVDMLKVRFGSEAHAERYRAELARLRRGTMLLEQLHLRVHSLVGRAMPGPWSRATEIYARDAFLTALDDDDLRRRIMMACPPPDTLSGVFDLAVSASAIDEAYPSYTRRRNVENQQRTEKYPKFSRVLSAIDSADEGVVSRSDFQRILDDQRKLPDELEVCREHLTKAESTM
jgi:hypothetical protein